MTNRKSHTRFRLVPKSTLDVLVFVCYYCHFLTSNRVILTVLCHFSRLWLHVSATTSSLSLFIFLFLIMSAHQLHHHLSHHPLIPHSSTKTFSFRKTFSPYTTCTSPRTDLTDHWSVRGFSTVIAFCFSSFSLYQSHVSSASDSFATLTLISHTFLGKSSFWFLCSTLNWHVRFAERKLIYKYRRFAQLQLLLR